MTWQRPDLAWSQMIKAISSRASKYLNLSAWPRNSGATAQSSQGATPPANMCLVSPEKNQAGQSFHEAVKKCLYSTVARLTSDSFDEGDALMILSTCLKWLSTMKDQDLVSKCLPKTNPCQTFTHHANLVGVALLRMGFKYSLTRVHEVREFMEKVDPQRKLDRAKLLSIECDLLELIGPSGVTDADDLE